MIYVDITNNTVSISVGTAPVNNVVSIKSEGSVVGSFHIINFTGAGVTATRNGDTVNVDIPGGGGTEATFAEALAGTGSTQMMSPRRVRQVTQKVFNIEAYGAVGDDLTYADGAVTGTAFTSSLATFTSSDVGKAIKIAEAGVAGAELLTTIAVFVSAHAVTLTVAASTSVSGKSFSYGTDNTSFVQATANALRTAGGGVLYVPSGKYAFAGAFVTSDILGLNPNAMLYIAAPASISASASILDSYGIIIRGESNGVQPNSNGSALGAVFHCYRNQGTGTRPSFIGGTGQTLNNFISGMNYATISFENITLVHSSNGGVTPTNMITLNGLDYATVMIDKVVIQMEGDMYDPNMVSPLGSGGCGFIVSRKDNNGSNTIKNLWIAGSYEYGAVIGEHTYLNGINVNGCYNNFVFLNANFNVIGNIVSNFSVNHITFPNASLFGQAAGTAWVNLDWEFETSGISTPPAWLVLNSFITDAGSNGRGRIRYNYQDGQDFGNLMTNQTNYGLIVCPMSRAEFSRQTSTENISPLADLSGLGNKAIFEISPPASISATSNDSYSVLQLTSNQANTGGGAIAAINVINRATGVSENRSSQDYYYTGADAKTAVWAKYLQSVGTLTELFTASIALGMVFALPVTSTQFKLSALNTAPASASATGILGEVRIDANYIYVCTATNTWKRVAIATW